MYMASYDWRLAFKDMELRDGYFTRLRQQIETLVSMNGKKAVVVCHSMGGNVWHYFMQWATHRVHRNWVHDHICSDIMISTPILGLPKAYFSLLTGDNRDFVTMGKLSTVVNHFFDLEKRRALWRTCSSLAMLVPMGGDALWGQAVTGRPMVYLANRNLTVNEMYDLLASKHSVPDDLARISPWLLEGMRGSQPAAVDRTAIDIEPPEHWWGNPLVVPLPIAPLMRKYAFHGVGVPTEISGVLQERRDDGKHPR
eukprot:gnl/TRDRNA2_/TRDRNA2_160792_c0_seq2.p1 gnl/TRDRNA2_/TRDRNA2_160792_c0~~gnl/TRDRNA2_/TRDRNA2_160792_c0_seq2.p1  ORF type:complete len:254 (-),score=24.52 gnl/TRDRNA2_/TRDRNA2_160792_c0_seq2:63-824(-)